LGDSVSNAELTGLLAYAYSIEREWTLGLLRKFPLGAPDEWRPHDPADGEQHP